MSAIFYGNVANVDLTYEPNPINNTNTTVLSCNIGSSGAATFIPFQIPGYVACGNIEMIASMNFLTVGAVSGRQTQSISYGLYTRQTGASSTNLSVFTSGLLSLCVTGNNSSYTISQPTSSGSVAYTYSTTNSSGENISSQYTGAKLIQFPIGSTLSPGPYWMGIFVANSTSSNNLGMSQSFVGAAIPTLITALAPIGSLTTAFSTGTNVPLGIGGNWELGLASYTSANQTNLPVSVAISNLTQNIATVPYFRMVSSL
jgi:hypothetical protein